MMQLAILAHYSENRLKVEAAQLALSGDPFDLKFQFPLLPEELKIERNRGVTVHIYGFTRIESAAPWSLHGFVDESVVSPQWSKYVTIDYWPSLGKGLLHFEVPGE